MQREKASAFRMFVDGEYRAAFDEPRVADDGVLPYATADTARLAVPMATAAMVRAVGGHARCSRAATRVLLFIVPSSGLDDRLAACVGVRPGRRTARGVVALSANGFTLSMFARPR
jgi:hypothetical protein